MKWIFLLSLSFISYNLKAQVPAVFIESSNVLGVSSKNAALAKAIVDMNGDFRDDILTMDRDSVYLEIQMNDGMLFKKVFAHPVEKGPFTINAGDLDNDGLNDFLHAGFYDDINIFHNEGGFEFTKMAPTDESVFAQGSSLFDINNDGWLDAVITHDDAASIVLINDGQGNLLKEQDVINFSTQPASDNSGNYSAIWVDLNQDDQLDLYIAKCRAGVSDPTDPRRINLAYINNNGSFTEMAADMNLDIGDQSWCTDSGDLDNDGDIDMVLINHEAPHMILENKGDGNFEHHIDFTDRGPFVTYDLEVAVQDFNNDGWQDILIGGTKDYLLINEGGLQFKRYDNPFGAKNASAFGVGDLNSDGYLDAYISFGGPDVPSVIADETWINFGGNYNHFKCTLQGIESNASGIGAKLELYGSWGRQVKWLNSGTAYGITNSLSLHFGLAEATAIDSCIISWPSGTVDKYTDLKNNTHYTAVEGQCIEPVIDLELSKLELSCDDDVIEIGTSYNKEINFSNGASGNMIAINSDGLISAQSADTICKNLSGTYFISRIPELKAPILNYSGLMQLCEGDILNLEANINTPITWQDGSNSSAFTVNRAGEYFFTNANECDTLISNKLRVEYTDFDLMDSLIVVEELEDIALNVEGDSILWYSDMMGNGILAYGNEFVLTQLNSDTQIYYQVFGDRVVPSSFGGEQLIDITSEYSPENINPTMLIDILQPTVLESFEVETDSAGLRRFMIMQGNDTLHRYDIDLSTGVNQVMLNEALQEGAYILTTDRNINMNTFGYLGPRLASHSGTPVEYPFYVNNLVRINSSGFGNGFYYYLYNLQARPYFEDCKSGVYNFEIELDTTTSINQIESLNNNIHLYPNPAKARITLSSDKNVSGEFIIVDALGRSVMKGRSIDFVNIIEINVSMLPKGLYTVLVYTTHKWATKSFIKL